MDQATGVRPQGIVPAMAIARPSQLAGEVPPGPPTATFVVRYTLKTKMTTIAFSPAEPQSHSAHTITRDLLTVAHFIVPGMRPYPLQVRTRAVVTGASQGIGEALATDTCRTPQPTTNTARTASDNHRAHNISSSYRSHSRIDEGGRVGSDGRRRDQAR